MNSMSPSLRSASISPSLRSTLISPPDEVSHIILYETDPEFIPIGEELIDMVNKYDITYELSRNAKLSYLEIADNKEKRKYLLLTILGPNTEHLPKGIDGVNDVGIGKIEVRVTDNIWKMFGILIFELINIRNLDEKNKQLIESSTNENEFATTMELIECQSVKDHVKLVEEGIRKYKWDEIIRPMNIKNSVCNAEETPHKKAYKKLFKNL